MENANYIITARTLAKELAQEIYYNQKIHLKIPNQPLSSRVNNEMQAVSKSRARMMKESKQRMELRKEMEEINELQAILNGNIDHTILYQKRIESKAQAYTGILI